MSKLDLKSVLYNMDNRNINYYDSLSDEMKKQFQPFVLMRFMSSIPNSALSPYAIIAVNEISNTYFWDLSKENELQAKLLACTGLEQKMYHKWIPNNIKSTDPVRDLIKEYFKSKRWLCNDGEINIFLQDCSEEDIEGLCNDFGKEGKETKRIVAYFKKTYM